MQQKVKRADYPIGWNIAVHTNMRMAWIAVEHCEDEADAYPRIRIGELTWFPDLEQLATLRDQITAYLAEHVAETAEASR